MSHLLDMPKEVMCRIMDYLELKSILTLRKVCHDLRNFIDDVTKLKIEKVEIKLDLKFIHVVYSISGSPFNLLYERNGKGNCTITQNSSQKTLLEGSTFVEAFLIDFGIFLGLQDRKSTAILEIFGIKRVDLSDMSSEVYQRALNRIGKILEGRKLKVKNFKFNTTGVESLLTILPHLDPEALISIKLQNVLFIREEIGCKPLEIDKIVELEQWKSAKEVVLKRAIEKLNIEDFKHFQRVFIRMSQVSKEELEAVRKSFLNLDSTSLRHLHINYSSISDEEEFFKQFRPPSPSNNGEEDFDKLILYDEWRFNIPNSPELSLLMRKYPYRDWNLEFSVVEKKKSGKIRDANALC